MKLHEAIAEVLRENKRPMSAKDIADKINKRNLYQRNDGNPVPISQIHARVNRYPTLFKKTQSNEITLASSSEPTPTVKETIDIKKHLATGSNHLIHSKYGNKITLENFKLYKEKVSIDLAPVTILTGKNNAGKSTLFKALILLSDYLNSNNQFILEFNGPLAHKHKIDSFKNAKNWSCKSKYFLIEFVKDDHTFSFTFGEDKKQGVLKELKIQQNKTGNLLKLAKLSGSTYSVQLESVFVDYYSQRNANSPELTERLENDIKHYQKEIDALTRSIEADEYYDAPEMLAETYDKINQLKSRIRRNESRINELKKNPLVSSYNFQIDMDSETDSYDYKIISMIRHNLSKYYNSEEFKNQYGVHDMTSERNKIWRFYQTLVNAMTINVSHLGPNRTHQARLYLNQNRQNEINEIINIYAHNKPRKGSRVESFLNKWLEKFDIGERIEVVDVEATASYVNVYEKGKKTPANLTDKGFGAGQVLTLLLRIVNEVQQLRSHAWRSIIGGAQIPIIIIEEPETSLHPSFQSKLAEMFYDAFKRFEVQFVLETHSEYLIRKTQTIIKHTKDHNVFKVYYIDKERGITEMRYREDGKFIDEFGSGFFDESTNLSLELF
jgi:predicted ATPase